MRIEHILKVRPCAASRRYDADSPFWMRYVVLTLPDGVHLRVIFVEDSSKDGTRDVLRRVADGASDVTYYALENRFGQGLATVVGVGRCSGDVVITMDADGTHPVSAMLGARALAAAGGIRGFIPEPVQQN
jgi:hypothetical protein